MLLADKLISLILNITPSSANYQLKESFINPVTNDTIFIHYIGPTSPRMIGLDYPISQAFMAAKKCFAMEGIRRC